VICGGKLSPPKYKATETPFDRHEARGSIFRPDLAFPFFERKDGNAKAAWSDNPTDAVREYGTSWGTKAKPLAAHLVGGFAVPARHRALALAQKAPTT
jgi:hypothetical protein